MKDKNKFREGYRSRLMAFFKSNLQRRLVIIIFSMAVVPILISSVVGNFWFQSVLKKSTVRELKLSNELISEKIENDLRYIQETMAVAFRFNRQNSQQKNRSTGFKSEAVEVEAVGNDLETKSKNFLDSLVEIFKKKVSEEPSYAMRQDLLDLLNNPNLFRSVHYIDKDGAHLGSHDINGTEEIGQNELRIHSDMNYSDDPSFIAFKSYLKNTNEAIREGNGGRINSSPSGIFRFSSPGTYISDVKPALDSNGEIIQPPVPVLNIWAVNRFYFASSGRGGPRRRPEDRMRSGEPLYLRLELNAYDFFQRIVSEKYDLYMGGNESEVDFVGMPNGDYLLHPETDCILCSLSRSGEMSWESDFPGINKYLAKSDNEVYFDSAEDRVVAVQRVYYDNMDDARHWVLIRSIPMEEVLSGVIGLRKLTVFLILILMLVVVPASLWITRGFTRPIRALVTATDRIAEGDLETDIPVRADDELGHLADSYEKMKGQIRNMIQYLKDRQSVAESANKAKSTFLANMSHELRTPLNGILGYAQILKQSPDLTPKLTEGVNVILRSGEHLLNLINDILDLSKVEAGRMELHPVDFSLPDMLENLGRIIDLRARQKKINFTLEKSKNLPEMVNGDDSRLRQVLMNLLSNAVKFTDAGEVSLIVKPDGKSVYFEVKDTGPGISREHIESIFSPFQQVGRVDRMTEGTGLGLAISRKLTNMLGGELKVDSKVGSGSRFYFTVELPLAEANEALKASDPTAYWMGSEAKDSNAVSAAKKASRDHNSIVGYLGKRRKVLIVDDKSENRAILKDLLCPLGFELQFAVDGLEAVETTSSLNPDCILMDLRMPRCDGYEATRKIRKLELKHQPIIITISASAFASNRDESLNAGANDFVPKPVRRSLLLETMHKHLDIEWDFEVEENHLVAGTNDNNSTEPQAVPAKLSAGCCEQLDQLIDLAKRGNLKGLEQQLSEMAQDNPAIQPLQNSLKPLIKGFKIKEINQILQESRADISNSKEPALS